MNRDDWNREGGQRLSAQRRPAHLRHGGHLRCSQLLENVWLEGKYWEPMPIENYDDPNNPDDTPRTITTQAAGVVINYKGELVRRARAALARRRKTAASTAAPRWSARSVLP